MHMFQVIRTVSVVGFIAVVGGSLTGCSVNPTTGKRSLDVLSPEQEIALGAEAGPQFVTENGGEVSDSQLKAYVTEVGMKLKQHVETDEQRNLPWTFTLLNSPEINAFALPGGKVNISLALAKKMTNEAQMAGVLGHEIGHVTARHANSRMGDTVVAGVVGAVLGAVIEDPTAGQLLNIGGETILMKFSRGEESEADALGMRYMVRAGYDPKGMRQVMEILSEASKGGGKQPEIFSTHPYPETRIKDIDGLLASEYAATQNNPKYTLGTERFAQNFMNRAKSVQPMDAKAFQQKKAAEVQKYQQLQKQLKQRRTSSETGGEPVVERVFDLSQPATWCAHCAAEAKSAP